MRVIKITKAIIVHIATTEWGFSVARNLMVISVLTNNAPDFLDHIKFTCSGVHISKVNDVHEKKFSRSNSATSTLDRKILRSNRYFFSENEYDWAQVFGKCYMKIFSKLLLV